MPFAKGQSGNPGGRPKENEEVKRLAREHTEEAIAALVDICTAGESESARVAAASAILDRGYGKPSQALTDGEGGPVLAGLTVTFVRPD